MIVPFGFLKASTGVSLPPSYIINEIDQLTVNPTGTWTGIDVLDSTHYVVSYQGDFTDGYVSIISHDGSGGSLTEIKMLEFDPSRGTSTSICVIDSTHFAIAYSGPDIDGFIKTFSVDGSYNITLVDTLEQDTNNNSNNSLILIDSTHLMLAYQGTSGDGFVKTFSIDAVTADNITQIDVLEFDTLVATWISLRQITASFYVIAYAGVGNDGFVKTFSIDGSYDNITQVDVLEHDTVQGMFNSVAVIDATHFAISYGGSGNDGWVKTFSIDGSADNITEIDSLEYDTANGDYTSLCLIDNTHLIVAYSGVSRNGTASIIDLDGSYNLTKADTLIYINPTNLFNQIVQLDDEHYAIVCQGDGNDCITVTLTINGI